MATPELAPFSKFPHHTSQRAFGPGGFSVSQLTRRVFGVIGFRAWSPLASGSRHYQPTTAAQHEQLCRWVDIGLPVVTKVLAAVRTLDRFGISDRAGAAIVSAALQDVGITSESNVLNVVDRNKIRRGRTKARTTLLSEVIKDYDHDQFGLYFDGRKTGLYQWKATEEKS
ncbi:hypothetical protein AVEN_165030-1 [Araneus ventricosus]|uniref:Uncharacterized protein n=1 Tax=Araneus ventricosus TaxID=182803 RepID=A0A4Y2GIE8_ARAVE|nr:hypothetical protein AVEN_165030-1 [Araneus ventricosus]